MKVPRKFPAIAYTVICIILLLGLLSGIGWLTNFSKYKSTQLNYKGNDGKTVSNTYDIKTDSKNFKIEALFGVVSIKSTSEKPYIKTVSPYNIDFDINNQDDVCNIKLKADCDIDSKFITNLFKKNKTPHIEIFLPNDLINKLNVETKAGKLQITDIKADTLDLKVSLGDVEIKNCAFDNIKTKLDAGNIDLYANNGINSIESTVDAGNMSLYIPDAITGFKCTYDVSAGNVDNRMHFDVSENQSTAIVSKNGTISYGDESCNISLKVSAGNIDILNY